MVNTIKMKKNLLREWGLEESVTKIRNNKFRYSYDLGVIDFIFLANEDEFYEIHNEIWCEDKTEFFLAVFKNGEIHVCDSKTVPDREQSLEKSTITSFKYGESTPESQKYGHLLRRESIEAGECIKEMQTLLSQRMRKSIDEDLMEYIELCRRKVSIFMKDRGDGEEIAEKIVDRCLFIRFLEDKSGNNNLINILKSEDGEKLLDLFDFYSNIFKNIFEKGDIPSIRKEVVRELAHVFGDSPYSSSPSTRYLFSHIPVTVVTRMYERILSPEGRKNPLTRERVREFTVETILDEPCIGDRIKKGRKIRILDPSCQSGGVLAIFLKKIIEKKGIKELREKIQILQKCFYGMDTSTRALRVTALNLYLNVIEGEKPDFIKSAFFSDGETIMLNVFSPEDSFCQKFDVIVCDLDTLEEKNIEKNSLQSSDFLLSIEEWMKRSAFCGLIVPLSYFITHESEKFRKDFLERYALKSFVNLSRMDTKNPACIIFFTNIPVELAEFYTPEHSFFSEVTGFIGKDNKARVKGVALKEDDSIWPVYALGFHKYRRLVKFLDNTRCSSLEDFLNTNKSTICNDEAFLYEKTKVCKEGTSTMYRTSSTTRDFKNVKPNHVAGEDTEQDSNNYVELVEGNFKKRKLIVQKTWPIRAFIDAYKYDDFWCYTLKASCPEEWLLLFESILNSKLASLYLEIKYRLGKGILHVEREHINEFPIPDLVDDYGISSKVIETVRLLKSLPCTDSRNEKVENDLEDLIFTLYGSNYYDLKETEQYIIEREKGDALVTEGVIRRYCEEFMYILHSFVKKGFFLKPEWATSESFGTMVRFTLSRTVLPLQCNKELERFVHIIEKQGIECEKKDVFKEKEIRFCDNNALYIYRSNKLRDWTEFMAIKDANRELDMYFQNLEVE